MKHLLLFAALSLAFSCTQPPASTTTSDGVTNAVPPANLKPGEAGISETVQVFDSISGKPRDAQRPFDALSASISLSPETVPDAVAAQVVMPKPSTPQETRIVRVLTTNYWVVEALHRMSEQANRPNQGAWFKLNPDGSYEYGQFDKKIGTGGWSFRYSDDRKKALLHFDSGMKGDDREWALQLGKEEDVMVWVGTSRYTTTDIQCKLKNLMFQPKNRKEMGLEE